MVLETNMTEILTRVEEQNKIEKDEVRSFIWKRKVKSNQKISWQY
jgi:hypothetical protein